MDWIKALIEWFSENWSFFKDNFWLFVGFGVIIVGIVIAVMLLFWKLLYGDKLKELPNLTQIKDELRRSQEENVQLAEENKGLKAENASLRDEIAALQTDRELLEGMKPAQTADTLGERISGALNN